MGKRWAVLVSLSTTTYTALNPYGIRGKPVTKSIMMCSHFHSRIGNDINSPEVSYVQPLLLDILDTFVQILQYHCWHSEKTNSQTILQLVRMMPNLSTLPKDKSQTGWRLVRPWWIRRYLDSTDPVKQTMSQLLSSEENPESQHLTSLQAIFSSFAWSSL